jgi:hypothetical protein
MVLENWTTKVRSGGPQDFNIPYLSILFVSDDTFWLMFIPFIYHHYHHYEQQQLNSLG